MEEVLWEEKDYFWELLGLLKKHQEVFFNENVSDTQESDLSSKVSCIYCGNTYKNEKGLKIHVKKCSEKWFSLMANFRFINYIFN